MLWNGRPFNSRFLPSGRIADVNEESPEEEDESTREDTRRRLTREEIAIFKETDALVIEMGNIVNKRTTMGNSVIDTAKANQHKDRYSALSYGLAYIADIERVRMERILNASGDECLILVDDF